MMFVLSSLAQICNLCIFIAHGLQNCVSGAIFSVFIISTVLQVYKKNHITKYTIIAINDTNNKNRICIISLFIISFFRKSNELIIPIKPTIGPKANLLKVLSNGFHRKYNHNNPTKIATRTTIPTSCNINNFFPYYT